MSGQHTMRCTILKLASLWLGLTALIVLLINCGSAQPKVYRIGILSGLDFFATTADGFKSEMAGLGYIEGKNISYDVQHTNSDERADRSILKKFVDDKVDLIFVFPTDVALYAKEITQGTNIPVLFANANIEGVDLVDSVREPGGNITGVRYPGPDLTVKRFDILHQIVPGAKRMWLGYKAASAVVPAQLEALRPEAAAAGVSLMEAPANTAGDVQVNLQAHAQMHDVDAILMIAEPLTVTPDVFAIIGKYAAERKIPVGGALMMVGDYASVFGVSTDNVAVGKQAAPLADKILKGTPAGSIPVASAENYIQINYKVAQALGLHLSEGLLGEANQIIR